MNFWIGIALATAFLAAALITLATKFFFPYHWLLALFIYGLGWIPFLHSLNLKRQTIVHYEHTFSSLLVAYWIHIVLFVLMVLVLYVVLVLFPLSRSPFTSLTLQEATAQLKDDKTLTLFLDDKLSSLLETAKQDALFEVDFESLTNEEKQQLRDFWTSYIESLIELDLIKDRYTTFYQINIFTKPDLHRTAFHNGYTAFLAQHYYTLQLQKQVSGRYNLTTFLNEPLPQNGIEAGTYTMITRRLTSPGDLLRLNAGRAYSKILNRKHNDLLSLQQKYLEGVDNSIGSYTKLIAKKPFSFLERTSYQLWFPIQKKAAENISHIRTTTRDYHITLEQIQSYKKDLLPGDILLQRREWHATNVGIPGYWTHSALYIGTLDELNEYFKDTPQLEGATFAEYMQSHYPRAHEAFQNPDAHGFAHSVIESKRPGVIFMSLENSAHADALAVLRTQSLTTEERFTVVTQALQYYGKPYDFNFDFVTDSALVCSELVYKAYTDIPKLSFQPKVMNGRLILSPNDMAKKYAEEYETPDAELELVLFLDGNERTGQASKAGKEEFIKSWQRPKWHIAQDFLNLE